MQDQEGRVPEDRVALARGVRKENLEERLEWTFSEGRHRRGSGGSGGTRDVARSPRSNATGGKGPGGGRKRADVTRTSPGIRLEAASKDPMLISWGQSGAPFQLQPGSSSPQSHPQPLKTLKEPWKSPLEGESSILRPSTLPLLPLSPPGSVSHSSIRRPILTPLH